MQLANCGMGKISYSEAIFLYLEYDSRQTNDNKSWKKGKGNLQAFVIFA